MSVLLLTTPVPGDHQSTAAVGRGRPAAAGGGRADRYLARVDAHLPTLPNDRARRVFLADQTEIWETLYGRFIATDGESSPGADASDFLLTITGLAARAGALAERAS